VIAAPDWSPGLRRWVLSASNNIEFCHVLAVDHRGPIRRALIRLLEAAGEQVEEAPDAESARAHVAASAPAVVVYDLRLPGANGIALAEDIRRISPCTAVVLLAGHRDIRLMEHPRGCMVTYVFRPITGDAVLHAVDMGFRCSASELSRHPARRQTASRIEPNVPERVSSCA
jgi:DNA-binding NtrC family response regulator